MRCCFKWIVAVATAILVAGGCHSAGAGFIGMPSMLGPMVKRISFGNFTLAPMAFTQFCLRYADQCKPPQIVFRGGPVRLTENYWASLSNRNV
jgi:predicted transglutaminase-like cysteine proteinase